jgi:transposase
MEDIKIRARIAGITPFLNEKQTRLYLAIESKSYGWGGKSKIAELSGASRFLISRGEKELDNPGLQTDIKRVRHKGGGRKKEVDKQAGVVSAILQIVEPHTLGDPVKPLLWTSKSVRHIQAELKKQGFNLSHELIRQILKEQEYSLQANRKTKEGGKHPDRDAQFEFINNQARNFISNNQPVISIDCKKKELIGEYKNNGREWHPVKNPLEVNVYDFIDKTNGKASPYGIFDVTNNKGWVSVGISSDTAAFAVSTIRAWWEHEGKNEYKDTDKLYINADGGGSNGVRNRLWKSELQQFANDTKLAIYVSHFPPGTSKWNKIEHRLFSYISMNWRGKPLASLAVILGLINGTTTKTGLTVKAQLDENIYPTGIKISDEEFEKINIISNQFHSEWNYAIYPN